jgi:polyphosphate kinase
VTELFNMITGYTRPRALRHLLVAPAGLRDGLVMRIRREAEHARTGGAGRIVAKMNSLADRALIDELYRASQAGVRVDLIVRGICCLRPGVPGLSDSIRVISIVDRYLEHARVFVFDNAGAPEYLLASSDWMPRNLDYRVETAFPILDRQLQRRLRDILDTQLADTVKARLILPDGRSTRVTPGDEPPLRSQERLYALAGPAGDLEPADPLGLPSV